MAHHVSGLGISPTNMDSRSHVTDLYVFQKPGDADKTILVTNTNPTSPVTEDAVDHESIYELGVRLPVSRGPALDRVSRRIGVTRRGAALDQEDGAPAAGGQC